MAEEAAARARVFNVHGGMNGGCEGRDTEGVETPL